MSGPAWIRRASSRWRCPECDGLDVQVSLPAWFRETIGGELRLVDFDDGADVTAWYCATCGESGDGAPVRVGT